MNMLYNKERPCRFDDMVGQKTIVENIRSQSQKDKFFSVYILGGQYGSGKTTMARIIALAANCQHKDEHGNPCLECESCRSIISGNCIDVTEIDGASNNGVDQVRELTASTSYVPALLKYKVIIIDEVHMLSKAAFNAFLKTLEEPPEYCIFILCTTEVNIIPATVRSRSATYSFKRICSDDICKHLNKVAGKYETNIEPDAAKLIAKNSGGALRNALALLEQCMMLRQDITAETVKNLLGIEDTSNCFLLLEALASRNSIKAVQYAENFYAAGKNVGIIITDMLEIIADTIMYLTGGRACIVNEHEESYVHSVERLAGTADLDSFFMLSDQLSELKDELRYDDSKTSVVVSFIKITKHLNMNYDALLDRIAVLEREIEKLKNNPVSNINLEQNSVPMKEEPEEDPEFSYYASLADEGSGLADEFSYYASYEDVNNEYPVTPEKTFKEKPADKSATTTESLSVSIKDKDSSEKEKTKKSSATGFDYMSLFMKSGKKGVDTKDSPKKSTNFPSVPLGKEGKKENTEEKNKTEQKNCIRNSRQTVSALDNLKSDKIISAAVERNCTIAENEDGSVDLYTPHQPVRDIIQAYIDAKGIDNVRIMIGSK